MGEGGKRKRKGASPCCRLYSFPPEAQCPCYRCWDFMCGQDIFTAFQTCAQPLADNGRGWALSCCQTLTLVRTKQQPEHFGLSAALPGFLASHIGHVVVWETCRNYMWLWPESKLRQRRPHPACPHVCTNRTGERRRRKREQHGWHQLWPEQFNRSVDGSRNPQKPLKSPAGGLN